MALNVELVSTDEKVWSGEASSVTARTVEGDLGILPGHSPLLAVLAPCDITIRPESGSEVVASCAGGFLSVEHDRVMIVSDSASMGARSTGG